MRHGVFSCVGSDHSGGSRVLDLGVASVAAAPGLTGWPPTADRADLVPLSRLGTADEITKGVVFLARTTPVAIQVAQTIKTLCAHR